ncbi:MAG: hypothetical protein WD181_06725, partial [Solirubrobacterales bacterium]
MTQPIRLESFGVRGGSGPWKTVVGSALLATLACILFQQMERDGGLTQPGAALDGAWILFSGAMVSVVLAVLLDWKLCLRGLILLPVVLLAALAVFALVSGTWSISPELEADRYGLLIFSYAAICLSAAVLSSRFGPMPLIVLVVGASVAVGAVGLWAFALERLPLATVAEGVLVPAGPFRYKNALALTSAAALLPLLRGISIEWRSLAEVTVFVLSSIGLAVCSLTVALSDSEFNLILAVLILAAALIWPASLISRSRQQAIGAVVVVVLVGIAGNLLYRKVLPAGVPEDSTRMVVMIALIASTPFVAWISGRLFRELPDRFLRFLPALAVGMGLLGAMFLIAGGAYSGTGGDLTQSRQAYYEITVETAKLNPIKGTGPGSYSDATVGLQAVKLFTTTRFAHSIPGEMWVELGIGGLIISILLYFAAVRASWRAFRIPFAALLVPLALGFQLNA